MNQQYCNGMIHVIKQGDNLYQLSRKYRVPLGLILRANPYVDVYNLQPGQEICIPVGRPYPGIMPPPFGMKPQKPRPEQQPAPPEMEKPPVQEQQPQMQAEDISEEVQEVVQEVVEKEVEEETIQESEAQATESTEYICDGTASLSELLQQRNISLADFLESNPADTLILAEGTKIQL